MDYPETQIWKKILSNDCDTSQLAYFDDDEECVHVIVIKSTLYTRLC